ncbi:MAG: IPT/TIG domain-containing protein, partial [Bryobacteraceae bacterium]
MRRTLLRVLLALSMGLAHQFAQAQTPTLTVSPATLTFSYQEGAAQLPAVQNVSVRATAGTPAFTTAVTSGSLWLTVSPDSGKLPGAVMVRVNPTGLGVGAYGDSVTITVTGAAPVVIPVTLNIFSPPPTLALSSSLLTFSTPPNPPTAQTVTLTTTGGPITFTATIAGAAWLSVAPTSGIVLPGEDFALTVNVDSSTLNPQATAFAGRITLVATGVAPTNRQQSITVSLTVNAVQPTISTLWPTSAQVNAPATTITLRGTNFYSGTTVQIAGVTPATNANLAATFISPTAMLAVIPAAQLSTAGVLNIIAT